jgi:hypothetical protein
MAARKWKVLQIKAPKAHEITRPAEKSDGAAGWPLTAYHFSYGKTDLKRQVFENVIHGRKMQQLLNKSLYQ